jgi:septum formation protein
MTSTPFVYLASQSPRRRQLLEQIGVSHRVVNVDVSEQRHAGESAHEFVARVALDKARAGWHAIPDLQRRPVLGADTVVVAGDNILGKPADRDAALSMLRLLSGRTHEVLTAVALVADSEAVRVCSSSVTFRTLTDAECAAYWETGEPVDKAGAYAVQGLAAMFIARLDGSYSGVMGLPLFETARLLSEAGIELLRHAPGVEKVPGQ